jgi:hypothetical protein
MQKAVQIDPNTPRIHSCIAGLVEEAGFPIWRGTQSRTRDITAFPVPSLARNPHTETADCWIGPNVNLS